MKKYKLIKEYPGSPKLNTIVEQTISNNFQWRKSKDHYYVQIEQFQVINYKEFWEEIVEKEYEILSFIAHDTIYTINDRTGIYINNPTDIDIRTLDYLLKNNHIYKIHSIKRLSDGEIFSIGDKLSTNTLILKEILAIEIWQNGSVEFQGFSGYVSMKDAKKAKTPLFTTEDNKEFFEGYYYYIDAQWKLQYVNTKHVNKYYLHYITFYTKEAAKEYAIMNKLCLSINDVYDILKSLGKSAFYDHQDKVHEIIKSKL